MRSVYSAAKAALNSLTANARMDLARDYPGIHISLVMPGPVSTDFIDNLLGATPGVRSTVSGALQTQTADEVAAVMVDLIDHPQPEVYTAPGLQEMARQYYQDIAAFEAGMRRPR